MPGRISAWTSCQFTLPAFCSITQKPASPSGVRMSAFLSERSMSISQAMPDGLGLRTAWLSMETKSITSARSKWSKRCSNGRRFVVTGHCGVS